MWLAEGYPMASAIMGFLPFPALESKGVSLIPNHFMVMLGYPSGSPMGVSCGEGVTYRFFQSLLCALSWLCLLWSSNLIRGCNGVVLNISWSSIGNRHGVSVHSVQTVLNKSLRNLVRFMSSCDAMSRQDEPYTVRGFLAKIRISLLSACRVP